MEIVKGPTLHICCCSPASCMIGLTKWVHLCAHNSAQCGLQNTLCANKWFHSCANDFTPWYTQSSTKWVAARFSLCASDWTHEYTILHKVSLSFSSHFVKSYCSHGHTILHKVSSCRFSLCESCWTHHGYTILHKVDSCSPHFVQVIGPMACPCSSQNFKFLLVIMHHLITLISINK